MHLLGLSDGEDNKWLGGSLMYRSRRRARCYNFLSAFNQTGNDLISLLSFICNDFSAYPMHTELPQMFLTNFPLIVSYNNVVMMNITLQIHFMIIELAYSNLFINCFWFVVINMLMIMRSLCGLFCLCDLEESIVPLEG